MMFGNCLFWRFGWGVVIFEFGVLVLIWLMVLFLVVVVLVMNLLMMDMVMVVRVLMNGEKLVV